MDDRFDRRELLLHLGDMLEASSCLARIGTPNTLVVQLAKEQDLFRNFDFLRTIAPRMTVADFSVRVASAFSLWPKGLLETELNRNALASTVQRDLFTGNPDGWNAYVAHIQKKVNWFGDRLPEVSGEAKAESLYDAVEEVSTVRVASPPERRAPGERKGWPWPDTKSTT